MTKASVKYWEKRRELEDKARLKMEGEMLRRLTEIYPEALEAIQEKLLSQSDLHKISINELMEDFSKRDQRKYRKYIDDNFQELMTLDETYQEFIDEFFPSYDYTKVNRLLVIRSDIFSELAKRTIGADANGLFSNGLEDLLKRSFASNTNALAQLLTIEPSLSMRKSELQDYLNFPWSGKTFSTRLWGNISRLEQNLSQSLVNAIMSGEGFENALKRMRGNSKISDLFKLEQGKFDRAIENLVRTEYAHFAVTGIRKSFEDTGVQYSKSWSAEDERVCSICGARHDKRIKDDWHPPYHGRCRCTEVPDIPNIDESIDAVYEAMFGDLLDEFAQDGFGVNLKQYRKGK